MVDDLLDVSRSRSGHLDLRPALCDLVAIVQESVEEQRRVWFERTITLDVPEEMKAPILADVDRIEQVITNYLTNALKYSDDNRPVQVSLRRDADEVRVALRDEGPGLSTEDQQLVWERFQRVPGIDVRGTPHSSTAGLGLGLYISKSIIEGHSGRVGVESTPGEGSTFWFTLPLARQEG
jgi:signal transduction histidine kinase